MADYTEEQRVRACDARLELDGRRFRCTEPIGHVGQHRMIKGKWIIHTWPNAVGPLAERKEG